MGRRATSVGPPITSDERAFLTLISTGVAAWALVVELLIILESKKILSDKKCRQIIEGATYGLISMDDVQPHPVIKVACTLLQGQIEGWDGVTGKKR